MEPHSLRSPSEDGEVLALPPLSEAASAVAANAEKLSRWDHDFQGRRATRLRPAVRAAVLARASEFLARSGISVPRPGDAAGPARLVVTGHQPELFHPGVWVKNFAAASIARDAGAFALNLIVDNDVPKGVGLRVPEQVGDGLRVRRVDFDSWHGDYPYEDSDVADEATFASFEGRVREALSPKVAGPLIETFWPKAVAAGALTDNVGLRFALARRAVEAEWGAHNLEVPLSQVCETEGFHWFACHLLAELPRFRKAHNDALAQYRALYGIRSRQHPVPALAVDRDWTEAPFWAWRRESPRRRPLFVRPKGQALELRIGGEDETLIELPLSADREACCAVEELATLAGRGVRLRTRALTTTMFARHLLGDLFLHGIGGAKYDELGDEIARRFFGVEPPPYMTLSMTLRLGLGEEPAAASRREEADRALRDLTFNPDRHLPGPPTGEDLRLLEAKRAAVAGPVETRSQRVERFHEIRKVNEALQGRVEGVRAALLADREHLLSAERRNSVARNREYSMVLHSTTKLRRALAAVAPPPEERR